MTKAVTELVEILKDHTGDYAKLCQFDDGKEFCNMGVKTQEHDIRYFSTLSDKKAAIIERCYTTLKTSIWKYLYSKGNCKQDDLVHNHKTKSFIKCGSLVDI